VSKSIKEPTRLKMKEKSTSMKEDCHSLLLLAEYEEKRMRILLQAVRFPTIFKGYLPRHGLIKRNRSTSSWPRKMQN